MGVEGEKDPSHHNPNRPTRIDTLLQFVGDRMGLGGPAVVLLNLAMGVGAPIAMLYERIRGSRENNIEEFVNKEEKGQDREDLNFI